MGRAEKVNLAGRPREESGISRALKRLAEPRSKLARERQTTARDVESLMRVILREIDETILPRQITLFTNTGAVARMVISNRRLVSLDVERELKQGQTDLPNDPESAARIYAKRLRGVFEISDEVSFRQTGRSLGSGTPSISCSAQIFAETAGLSLLGNESESKIDDFLERVKPLTRAWIRSGKSGGGEEHGGDSNLLERLRALAKPLNSTAGHKEGTPHLTATEATCQIIPIQGDDTLLYCNDRTERVLALINSNQSDTAMREWGSFYQYPS